MRRLRQESSITKDYLKSSSISRRLSDTPKFADFGEIRREVVSLGKSMKINNLIDSSLLDPFLRINLWNFFICGTRISRSCSTLPQQSNFLVLLRRHPDTAQGAQEPESTFIWKISNFSKLQRRQTNVHVSTVEQTMTETCCEALFQENQFFCTPRATQTPASDCPNQRTRRNHVPEVVSRTVQFPPASQATQIRERLRNRSRAP